MLERGDMVHGAKPWNKDTMLGIILQKGGDTLRSPRRDSYQVFWVNPKGKTPLNFITWEVFASVSKINGEKELDKKQ
tara:strand:+ start:2004 stop:2234 length:231 start_codon:yes stop_codon:yes gene_type:complete